MSSLPQVLRRFTVTTTFALLTVGTVTASEIIEYEYDALARLSKACYVLQSKLVTFSYDPAGNRTSVTTSAVACGNATFTIEDAPQTEVGSQMSFTVRRSGASGSTNAVNFATANGTALAGTHYTSTNGTLTFTSGQTVKTVPVNTIAGSIVPGGASKTLYVNLSSPTGGGVIATSQGSGTIVNTSPVNPTNFAIANAPTVRVGSPLSFTVTRTGPTSSTHAVNFATANGTAIGGTHYTTTSGTLTFTSGQTVKTVPVNTIAGSLPTGAASKTLTVNLSSPTGGALITNGQGNGTIKSNTAPVAVNDTHHGTYYVFDSVPVYVRANDSDADGDPITITHASCASTGCSVSIVNGAHLVVMATTNAPFKTVNYTISDGQGGTASATATVSEFFAQDPGCGEFWC